MHYPSLKPCWLPQSFLLLLGSVYVTKLFTLYNDCVCLSLPQNSDYHVGMDGAHNFWFLVQSLRCNTIVNMCFLGELMLWKLCKFIQQCPGGEVSQTQPGSSQ